ncbi:unnamed protein product [Gongylonema pulchrum]|uniref:Uncharacterized protein n=1 Tax=Gongylonema pulchrum TaxID=637853 RepID=A0A183DC84_9BILA|nr:unnamed protein product [Gongylonema pulchrum]
MNERCEKLTEVAGENSQQTAASCADVAMNLTSAVNENCGNEGSHVTVATDVAKKGSKLIGQDGASTAENSEEQQQQLVAGSPHTSRIPRSNLLQQLVSFYRAQASPKFASNRTAVSFKTPKRNVLAAVEHATVEDLTPPSSALRAISQYSSSSSSANVHFSIEFTVSSTSVMPQNSSNVLFTSKTPRNASGTSNASQNASLAQQSQNTLEMVKRGNEQATNDTTLNAAPAGPLTRYAFDHLKNGGTPRPTSTTRKILAKRIAEDNGVPSEPRTPPFARIGNLISFLPHSFRGRLTE